VVVDEASPGFFDAACGFGIRIALGTERWAVVGGVPAVDGQAVGELREKVIRSRAHLQHPEALVESDVALGGRPQHPAPP